MLLLWRRNSQFYWHRIMSQRVPVIHVFFMDSCWTARAVKSQRKRIRWALFPITSSFFFSVPFILAVKSTVSLSFGLRGLLSWCGKAWSSHSLVDKTCLTTVKDVLWVAQRKRSSQSLCYWLLAFLRKCTLLFSVCVLELWTITAVPSPQPALWERQLAVHVLYLLPQGGPVSKEALAFLLEESCVELFF